MRLRNRLLDLSIAALLLPIGAVLYVASRYGRPEARECSCHDCRGGLPYYDDLAETSDGDDES